MSRHLFASAAVAALLAPFAVHGQETTSSIRGTVTANGAPVANATITVLHVPSGTRAVATSGADGNFDVSGLRIGGPFTISVAAKGFPGGIDNEPLTGCFRVFSGLKISFHL